MSAEDALHELASARADDLGLLLASAAQAVNHEVFQRLVEVGETVVRPAHLPVFAGLDPEGSHISTLAARAGFSRQAMSSLVRDMETAGYVRTVPDAKDRRAVLVQLTDRGTEFCLIAVRISREVTARWRGSIGDDRFDELLARLRTLGAR
jgi:DNA-binding MarR family transcriptional regulator